MSTGAQPLKQYEEGVAGLSPDQILGHLAFFRILDRDVPHGHLLATATKFGLENYVPAPPHDNDKFRTTFTNGQHQAIEQRLADGTVVIKKLLVRSVATKPDRIVKRVVVELVDAQDEQLEYTEAYDVVFGAGAVSIDPIGTGRDGDALDLAYRLAAKFQLTRGCIDGNGVRNIVTRALKACLAVDLDGTGVYFVAAKYTQEVEALEECMKLIEGAKFHSSPLADTPPQRQMVAEGATEDLQGEVDSLATEMAVLLSGNNGKAFGARRVATLAGDVSALTGKIRAYSKILSDKEFTNTVHVNTLRTQLKALEQMVTAK